MTINGRTVVDTMTIAEAAVVVVVVGFIIETEIVVIPAEVRINYYQKLSSAMNNVDNL